MEAILKSEIFFVVSTVSIVIITILLIVVLIYFISILKRIKKGVNSLDQHISKAAEDISLLKDNILEKINFLSFLNKIFSNKSKEESKEKSQPKITRIK